MKVIKEVPISKRPRSEDTTVTNDKIATSDKDEKSVIFDKKERNTTKRSKKSEDTEVKQRVQQKNPIGRDHPPIREKKMKNPCNQLDTEVRDVSCFVRLKTTSTEEFFCFRCNITKTSKNKYTWSTSEGEKIVCNGCYGNLVAKCKVVDGKE